MWIWERVSVRLLEWLLATSHEVWKESIKESGGSTSYGLNGANFPLQVITILFANCPKNRTTV
ncbi:hypothetical protein BVRB_1g017700 [Beta vulgaris subsp. vulgaris]|nr:hypothetical protein BVRB_1g017700 [Beta vulgaris subsp. vulgaris]